MGKAYFCCERWMHHCFSQKMENYWCGVPTNVIFYPIAFKQSYCAIYLVLFLKYCAPSNSGHKDTEYLAGLKFGSKMRNCWIAGGKENHRSRFSKLAFNSKKSKKVWSGQFISTMHPFISTKWDPYVGWIFERAQSYLNQNGKLKWKVFSTILFCKDMSLNMTLCWLCVWPRA